MATNQFSAGADTTRLTVIVSDDTARQQAAARRALSQEALARFPAAAHGDQAALLAARQWRDDMYATLGLTTPAVTPVPASPKPPIKPTQPRVVARIRNRDNDEDWRKRGACRDEDPELFFPIGDSGPAVLQIEQAKAVCRRCDVREKCLQWALDAGQDSGVWGGMSEVERRACKEQRKHLAGAQA